MLYRVLLVSETVSAIEQSPLMLADILGASERNNRRDMIGSAMMFHEGRAAMMLEGMRADVDRLIARLLSDRRHRNLKVVEDRPIVHRRVAEPVQLNALSTHQAGEYLGGRRLDQLAASVLERLLSCDRLRVSTCAV
ncbi:MAG: BLUF domain-containing protein [Brevundimonas sp.]|uniref:BLUF domain-containing protein n=1 Tax=Brevundimonas sp. TaxID=1871086 RepID=UPI0027232A0A|nr:BLUF domain-containing protein [Brevundimonas sp.]MDO9609499.1 BLUF domain-containing protein [Brevundimonas sp.]